MYFVFWEGEGETEIFGKRFNDMGIWWDFFVIKDIWFYNVTFLVSPFLLYSKIRIKIMLAFLFYFPRGN